MDCAGLFGCCLCRHRPRRAGLANHFLACWGCVLLCAFEPKVVQMAAYESIVWTSDPRILSVRKGAAIPLKDDHQRHHLFGFWRVNLWNHQSWRPWLRPGNNSHRRHHWRLVGGLESPHHCLILWRQISIDGVLPRIDVNVRD